MFIFISFLLSFIFAFIEKYPPNLFLMRRPKIMDCWNIGEFELQFL